MKRVVASSMMLAGVAALGFCALPSGRGQTPGQEIRVIEDAAMGDRWLLLRNASDPGGPGRMVRVANPGSGAKDGASKGGTGNGPARTSAEGTAIAVSRPVIHEGDEIVVEEHSAVVDARLQATALESAVVGAGFRARMKIGGKVVKVMALAHGKAELEPVAKAQR